MKIKIEIDADQRGGIADMLERILHDVVNGCELNTEGTCNDMQYKVCVEHTQVCLANSACSGTPCSCGVEVPDIG